MIWLLVVNPVLLALAGAIGVLACRAGGINPHVREMLIAGGICLTASELAALPALFQTRSDDAGAITRSAMAGTVVHLGVVLIFAVGVILVLRPSTAFAFWMLALYWMTLIGLCSGFAFLLRRVASGVKSEVR